MTTSMARKSLLATLIVGMIGFGSAALAQDQDQEAEADLTLKLAEADYLRARLARVESQIAVLRYTRDTFQPERETSRGEMALARAEFNRAEDRLRWSTRMHEKGFVSKAQLFADQLGMSKAQFTREQSQAKLAALEEQFTRMKTFHTLQSDVAKARSDEAAREADYERAETTNQD